MTASTIDKICFLFLIFLQSSIVAQDTVYNNKVLSQILNDYKNEHNIDSVDLFMSVNDPVVYINSSFRNHRLKNDSLFKKIEQQIEIDNFIKQRNQSEYYFQDHLDELPDFINYYNSDSNNYKLDVFLKKYPNRLPEALKNEDIKSLKDFYKNQKEFLVLSAPFFTLDEKVMIIYFETFTYISTKIYCRDEKNNWKEYATYSIFFKEYY